MIWNSVSIMSVIDVLMIIATVLALIEVRSQWAHVAEAKGGWAAVILVCGLGVVGLFYVADLATMWVVPVLVTPEAGMAAMEGLHFTWAWIVIPLGFALAAAGLALLIRRVARLVSRLQATEERMTLELEARKSAEASLRRSEAVLAEALSAAATGTWAWELDTGVVSWSREFETVMGLVQDEFGGTMPEYLERIHPDDRPTVESALQDAVSLHRRFDVLHRVLRPDGSVRWVEIKGRLFCDPDGKPVRMTGTGTDVTERKNSDLAREELNRRISRLQRLESLGVLAGGVAHDFNNIFVSMLGHADLAEMEVPPDSPLREHIQGFRSSALRASDLTNQLLAYSGKGQFRMESLDVNGVVEETLPLLHSALPKKARLALKLDPKSTAVTGDVSQVRQALMNLVSNAGEALDGEPGTVTIRTAVIHADRTFLDSGASDEELPEGSYVLLEVADDGAGMDEDVQQRMFDPFFTTRFTGRGLGLAAVLGIMQGHHGTVRVTSQVSKGTGVQILLPVATSLPVTAQPEPVAPRTVSDTEGGVVLVVDDEEPVRRVAKATLERAGFAVVTAKDGRDGVERFQEYRRSVVAVLLDATMPVMGGREALKEIRAIDRKVPVVFTSGYTEHQLSADFGTEEALRFLQKPFRPQALVEEIRLAATGSLVAGD